MLKKDYLILGFALMVIFFSRIAILGKYGLAGDEKYTSLVSQFMVQEGGNQAESIRNPTAPYFTPKQFWAERSFKDFLEAIARRENGSGALYFLSLHYWTHFFGISDFSLRFLSFIFSIFHFIFLYFFFQKFFHTHKIAKYLLILFATISPFYFNYALVARNYSLTFFLALLATYLFIKLLESPAPFYKNKYFWTYSLSLTFMLFGHHSTIIVLPIHFLILIFNGRFNKFFTLGFAMLLPILCLGLWSLSEGGKYTYGYIQNSKAQYHEWARLGIDSTVKFSTFSNVLNQFSKVFTYLFFPMSGMGNYQIGTKNTIFSIILGIFYYVLVYIFPQKKYTNYVLIGISIVAGFLFSLYQLQFLSISFGIFLLLVIVRLAYQNRKNRLWLTCSAMAFVPISLLILYAIMDGVTMRISARYAGIAYPFLLILTTIALENVLKKNQWMAILGIFGMIFAIIIPQDLRIIKDESVGYFQSIGSPREANPYKTLADLIIKNYQKGDTVLYCSQKLPSLGGVSKMPDFSMQDAQYTNLYLPKEADFIQRGDTTEANKVYLYKLAEKKKVFLMDLSNRRY